MGLPRPPRPRAIVESMVRALQHVASTHHVELVIAGKEDPLDLLLLVALGDDVAPEDLEPALAIPDLFPAVGRAMPPAGFTGLPAAP